MRKKLFVSAGLSALVSFCGVAQMQEELSKKAKKELAKQPPVTVQTAIGTLELPSPFSTKSVEKSSEIVPWPSGQMPIAPKGFKVSKFAEDLDHPRRSYVAPGGTDIFVVESDDAKKSANRITLFKDANMDGKPEERFVFAEGLNQPYGMLILDGYFYVANVDAIKRWSYRKGMTTLEGEGEDPRNS